MFLFAFNTFARVGEITLSSDKSLKNLVKIEDVQIVYLGEVPYKISLTFRNFKHSKGQPHVIGKNLFWSIKYVLVRYLIN